MKKAHHPFVTALAAALFLGAPGVRSAETVVIADSTQGFTHFFDVAINDSGVVVFIANKFNPATGVTKRGVYKGSGGNLVTVAEVVLGTTPGAGEGPAVWADLGESVDIANGGGVAFFGLARHDPPPRPFEPFVLGVFTQAGPGNPALPGQATGLNSLSRTFGRVFINSKGFYLLANSQFSFLGHPTLNASTEPTLVATAINEVALAFNDRNQILHLGRDASNRPVLKRTTFKLLVLPGNFHLFDSAPITETIATDFGASFPGHGEGFGSEAIAMNDSGTVAYRVVDSDGLVRIKRGGTTVVEWDPNTNASFQNFFAPNAVGINDSGTVFFDASGAEGPNLGIKRYGIFRGADPVLDKVVAIGDVVAGSPILTFEFSTGGWKANNSGQVVALVQLEDNRRVLIRTNGVASPPPPPVPGQTIRWVGSAVPPPVPPPDGEPFAVHTNWNPQRVPEKSETRNDIARFDLPALYSVDVGTQTSERLLVLDGQVQLVVFQPDVYRVGALSPDQPSVVVNHALMRLLGNGRLKSIHALIGESAASRVDVDASATWETTGSLRVGGAGEGILNVGLLGLGGTVISGEARVGTGIGGGVALVTRNGSLWRTGNFAIGAGGRGELTVEKGGRVESASVVIGEEAGVGNVVKVIGGAGTPRPVWQVSNSLIVGEAGSGRLFVGDGGLVETAAFQIGAGAGATGSIVLDGVHPDDLNSFRQSMLISKGTSTVGGKGQGELRLLRGGTLQMGEGGDLFIGPGLVEVSGVDPADGISSLLVMLGGSMLLGTSGEAELNIMDGGAVSCSNLEVGSGIHGGRIIVGANSGGLLGTSTFGATGSIRVGMSGGEGLIRILGGTVQADGILEVGPNGRVEGFGKLATQNVKMSGAISIGQSPGLITVEGNYEQTPSGRMIIEIGGTDPSRYDQLVVTGTTALDGTIVFKFIDGFLPSAGQEFPFLRTAEPATGAFSLIEVQNLEAGFNFEVGIDEAGNTCLRALNNGVSATGLPGTVEVEPLTIGGVTYLAYTITTSSPCRVVRPSGLPSRVGTSWSHSFEGAILSGMDCPPEPTTTEGILVLGALASGDYPFNIVSNGEVLETIDLTVAAGSGSALQVLSPLPDGSVPIQIQVPGAVPYQLDASGDLQNWTSIFSGTGSLIYHDVDAPLFGKRFYQLHIGRDP